MSLLCNEYAIHLYDMETGVCRSCGAKREDAAAMAGPTPDVLPCVMRTPGEMLAEVIGYLQKLGAFIVEVRAEAVSYRVVFSHRDFDGCETDMLFSREPFGKFTLQIRNLGPASCDTHPKGGDAKQGSVHG